MIRRVPWSAIASWPALLFLVTVVHAQATAPTVILHNAVVFTGDGTRPRAQAIAISGDRVLRVGSDAEILALAGDNTEVVDVGGRLVVPGLNDAHVHIGPWPSMANLRLSGPDDPSWETVLDSVRVAVAALPAGTWIAGEIGGAVLDHPEAHRSALDAVSPDHPVRLVGFTGHGLLVNSAALREIGVSETEPDPVGGWYGRIPGSNRVDGWIWEYAHMDANFRTSSPIPRSQAVDLYRRFANRMLRWGVTSVQHMENDRPLAETLAALTDAEVPLRWSVIEMPTRLDRDASGIRVAPRAEVVPGRVRVLGTKWVLDGTPVDRRAALRSPYSDRPEWTGSPNLDPDAVRAILRAALDSDGQAALHVVGDSTLAVVLRQMAALAPAETWRERRVRIEHGDVAMPDQVPVMAEFGLVLIQNPLHLALPQFLHARFGPERSAVVQPLRSAVAAGVPLALGTDASGSGRNPWLNLMMATIHPTNPAEAISVEQALLAFTRGAAEAERSDAEKGTLAPGMLADLAVLSQNVFEIPPDALPSTESVLTMVGGEIVYRSTRTDN